MKPISEKEWLEDFQEFVKGDGIAVPDYVSRSIHDQVRTNLSPSSWKVFAKLLLIHAVVGTLSLLICDQFEMSPFRIGFSLADYFMKFGHSTCMTLCGVIFLSLTVSVSGYVFRGEELRVLVRNSALQIFGLSSISLGVFAALGAEIALSFGALWLVGAELGGLVVIPAIKAFRPKTSFAS